MQARIKHPWLMWSFIVLFYFYQYFLRVCPVVLTEELTSYFRLDASELGSFSAFYFFIYAFLQIPVGLLIDRFGSKFVIPSACLVCGLGTLILGLSPSFWLATIGRFLQGAGSSFAFIGMIYITAHYFPISLLGFLICLGDSLGKLGAVFASGPFAKTIEYVSWRSSLLGIGCLGVILSLGLYFTLPRACSTQETLSITSLKHTLKTLVEEKSMWMICLVSSLLVVTTTAFAGLWGAVFLEISYSMSKTSASFAISVFFLGSMLGSPSLGYISDRLGKRKPFLFIAGFFGTLLFSLLVYYPYFSTLGVYTLLFILGILTSIQNLTYCVAIENNPPKYKGAITGYVNLFVFLLGAISQPLVGFLMERHSTVIFKSSGVYTLKDFQYSFGFFPLCFALAFVFVFFINDKKKV
jgi:sugar phosphate permease